MPDAEPTWKIDDELARELGAPHHRDVVLQEKIGRHKQLLEKTVSKIRLGQVTLDVYLSPAVFYWSETLYTDNHGHCLQSHRSRPSPNHCLWG